MFSPLFNLVHNVEGVRIKSQCIVTMYSCENKAIYSHNV